MLSAEALRRFRLVRDQVGDWRSVIDGAGLVVLDASEKPLDALTPTSSVLLREPGVRSLHRDEDIAVIMRAGARWTQDAADADSRQRSGRASAAPTIVTASSNVSATWTVDGSTSVPS